MSTIKRLSARYAFNESQRTNISVQIADIAAMTAPFQNEVVRANSDRQDAINRLSVVRSLLTDGFKFESQKGQLYYALDYSIGEMITRLKAANDEQRDITLSKYVLETFKTSHIQLSEAALLYGGAKDILPQLRWAFPNDGYGHADKAQKYKGDLLRQMVRVAVPIFYSKYDDIGELTHEQLEFFETRSEQAKPATLH
ncbi:MAG: hypothetical protein ACK4VI_09620 [Alphaproteobacteria bacterium]